AAWDAVSKCWIGSADGTDLPLHLSEWLAAGARLVGGCCGVGTKGIAALAAARARH
ncbi:MAG: Homocysteine S-methyltransferase, partial [Actinomycetota bacterium]